MTLQKNDILLPVIRSIRSPAKGGIRMNPLTVALFQQHHPFDLRK